MNVGALIVMVQWLKDIEIAGGPIGPPTPVTVTDYGQYYRPDGKLTYAGYKKFVDSAASTLDYHDYLKGS